MNDEPEGERDPSSFILLPSSLLRGIERFNEHRFWDAHEAWETAWLRVEGDEKLFLQGLIQLAAAYHHVQRGTHRGALRLFDASLRKLSRFPADYLGVDRAEAVTRAEEHRTRVAKEKIDAGEYPKIRYN
jgi:predicted metal-dependent hydrolase